MREPQVTKTINRAPFPNLILIFSESLQSWQQIQVRYCFRNMRFYKEPQLTHLLTPGIKPTPGSHSEWANLPIQSQGELCRYSAATQWHVGEKAPCQRRERTVLCNPKSFPLESKVRRRQGRSAVPACHSTMGAGVSR